MSILQYYTNNEKHCPGSVALRNPIVKPNWQINNNNVSYDKQKDAIGSGNFCSVFKGKYKRPGVEQDEIVAIKVGLNEQTFKILTYFSNG